MPSPPSYGCCTRVNFVLKKHLLFQMNLSNSGLKNRSIKEYWLIFTVLKFPLGLQFSHNLTKFKIIKYISSIYIMTTTCTYLQQLTQVSDVAHGPLVFVYIRFMSWDVFPMYLHCIRLLRFFESCCFFLTQTGISCLQPLHVMGWFSYVFALYTFVTLFERCI